MCVCVCVCERGSSAHRGGGGVIEREKGEASCGSGSVSELIPATDPHH